MNNYTLLFKVGHGLHCRSWRAERPHTRSKARGNRTPKELLQGQSEPHGMPKGNGCTSVKTQILGASWAVKTPFSSVDNGIQSGESAESEPGFLKARLSRS